MKLYTKGERRYTEAKDSEVLMAAARILGSKNILSINDVLYGMSVMMKAEEDNALSRATKTLEAQEKNP